MKMYLIETSLWNVCIAKQQGPWWRETIVLQGLGVDYSIILNSRQLQK